MAKEKISTHFVAAQGLDHLFEKEAKNHLQAFYMDALGQYRQEIQYERARLMRQNPLDYPAVRRLDRELEHVSGQLFELQKDDN